MQKVYLLLRSNKKTGPYSLEELVQLNLKPFDLVWVEGRSAAWQYPFEIPALQPYVPETPQAEVPFQPVATAAMEEKFAPAQSPQPPKTETPKRVFVSVPKTYQPASEQTIYENKEEAKLTASSLAPSVPSYAQQKPSEEAIHTNYSRSLNELEDDYTHWTYKQKTRKKTKINPKDFVLIVLILAVIGGGYYVISKPSVANSVLPANKTATQALPLQNKPQPTSEKEILSQEEQTVPNTNDPGPVSKKNIKMKNPASVSRSQTAETRPSVQDPMPVEKTTNIPDDKSVVSKEPELKQPPKEEGTTERKKKLGEVIKGIFSRKDRKEETKNDRVVLDDPKPATNRQATKREGGDNTVPENSNEVNTADLMNQVDLSSNAPENWMMGVRNLKITLRNRGNTTIQTASVTVNYYDENNQLLEKKLIYFNNVGPKARATVAAPDHKWADHVDFKLATVSAKQDGYARY